MARFMVPEIWCDLCSERILADGAVTMSDLVKFAEDRGWVFRPSEPSVRDLCPDCAELRFRDA